MNEWMNEWMNECRKLVTRTAVEQVESEARAVAGRAKVVELHTLRVVREVRWVFNRRLKVSNMFDSLIAAGNSSQVVGAEKLKLIMQYRWCNVTVVTCNNSECSGHALLSSTIVQYTRVQTSISVLRVVDEQWTIAQNLFTHQQRNTAIIELLQMQKLTKCVDFPTTNRSVACQLCHHRCGLKVIHRSRILGGEHLPLPAPHKSGKSIFRTNNV